MNGKFVAVWKFVATMLGGLAFGFIMFVVARAMGASEAQAVGLGVLTAIAGWVAIPRIPWVALGVIAAGLLIIGIAHATGTAFLHAFGIVLIVCAFVVAAMILIAILAAIFEALEWIFNALGSWLGTQTSQKATPRRTSTAAKHMASGPIQKFKKAPKMSSQQCVVMCSLKGTTSRSHVLALNSTSLREETSHEHRAEKQHKQQSNDKQHEWEPGRD